MRKIPVSHFLRAATRIWRLHWGFRRLSTCAGGVVSVQHCVCSRRGTAGRLGTVEAPGGTSDRVVRRQAWLPDVKQG